ncbi:hypothetical protein F444_12145 [Phytophthora nicotianae P1976]|uniref:RxLR effector protein n=1 Tax=Phytophthora nicotianae P1976 TaxID=1317066 RepID=A0A080ZY49_PHYNI|nr:hypothetical protein F444_12145 [Phytophthora nicotianae P1976]
MRLQCAVVLVAILACVVGVSLAKKPETTEVGPFATTGSGITTGKLLKSSATNAEGDEERLTGLEKLTKVLESVKLKYKESSQLDSWLTER